jgi:PAN domain
VPPGAQAGKDRPGSDYSATDLASADPNLCYNACQADGSCAAWSYVKPGVMGPNAKCFLKNPAPAPTINNCCISGAKAVPPPPPPSGGGPFEVNINRPGGDYIDFSSGGANTALLCLGACITQPACKAWSYVKPGIQGPQSHCWLKSFIPPAVIDNCCTSGVK